MKLTEEEEMRLLILQAKSPLSPSKAPLLGMNSAPNYFDNYPNNCTPVLWRSLHMAAW